MDTLSSSVTTLKVPLLHPTSSRELSHFKNTTTSSYTSNPPQTHLSSITKPPNKTTSFTSQNPFLPLIFSPFLKTSSQTLHRNPATGYAAALLDTVQCNGTLEQVEKDVQRFLKLMRNKRVRAVLENPLMGEIEKGHVVKVVAEKGRFNRHLVCLVKMLVGRNKVGIVEDVLEEFVRIYDELCGIRVVLVSSAEKMKEEVLLGIAKKVQKLTGAVKVKVRNLVHQEKYLPSFPL
ncbi:hypothetical protein UlMin_043557 [Ulmus minor]